MTWVVVGALLAAVVALWWFDPQRRAYAACVDRPGGQADFASCTARLGGVPQERSPEDYHRDPCWTYDTDRNPIAYTGGPGCGATTPE